MKGASVLELLVHNLHMYETLSVSAKIYKKIKQKRKMRKGVKKLCNCLKKDDYKIESRLEEMAQYFRSNWDQNEDRIVSPNWRDLEYRRPTTMIAYKSIPSASDQKCSNFVSTFTPH